MEMEKEMQLNLMRLIEDEETPPDDTDAAFAAADDATDDAYTHEAGSVATIASQNLPSVDVDDAATDYEHEAKKNGTTVSHRLAEDSDGSHDEKTLQENNQVESFEGVAIASSTTKSAATASATTATTATATTVHSQAGWERRSSSLRSSTGMPGAFAVDRNRMLRQATSAWNSDHTFSHNNNNNNNNNSTRETALVSAELVQDPQRVYGVPVVAAASNRHHHDSDEDQKDDVIVATLCDKIKLMFQKYPWTSISSMTIALILFIVLALLLLPKSQSSSGNITKTKGTVPGLPSMMPTLQPSSSNISSNVDDYKLLMKELNLSETCLSTSLQRQQDPLSTSPQVKALDWMLADPRLQSYPLYRKQQRYVVSLLYFAMENAYHDSVFDAWNYTNDINTTFQLSYNQSECDFFRDYVSCNHYDTYDDGQDVIETIVWDGQLMLLSTTLPCQLSLLSDLQVLDLSYADVYGPIPSQFGLLKDLRVLNLEHNDLTGTLPSEIYTLTNLEQLILSNNTHMWGTLSTQVGLLTNLLNLEFHTTSLSGSLPTQIGNLHSSLEFLYVEDNQMKGRLPTQLGRLTRLLGLSLGENDFTGTLPLELSDLVRLEVFFLNDAQITGTLPTQLGLMTNLVNVEWQGNHFHGMIPTELGQMQRLTSLMMYSNQLTGNLPAEALVQMMYLNYLDVSDNLLHGTVPLELTYLRDLTYLGLELNDFYGSIPQDLCRELYQFRFTCGRERPTTTAFAANSNNDSSTSSFLCGCDCSCAEAVQQEQQPFEGCSRRNQQELEIRLTTDDFGYETSWVLLEMDSDMVIDSVGEFELRDNTLYTTHLCLNVGSTYQFVIQDLRKDGICCSFGFGDYALVLDGVEIAVGFTFSEEDIVQFDVVAPTSPTTSPVPTLTPTTSIHPTGVHVSQLLGPSTTHMPSQIPSQLDCNTQDEVVFKLAIFTDIYPTETRWELRNGSIPVDVYNDTDIIYSVNYDSYVLNQTLYVERRCLDRGGNYSFVIYDAYGDGLIDGIGYYSLTVDNVEITSGSPNQFKEIVNFDVD